MLKVWYEVKCLRGWSFGTLDNVEFASIFFSSCPRADEWRKISGCGCCKSDFCCVDVGGEMRELLALFRIIWIYYKISPNVDRSQ